MIPNYYPDESPTSEPNRLALATQKAKILERIDKAVKDKNVQRYEALMKQLRLISKVEVKVAYAHKKTGIWK